MKEAAPSLIKWMDTLMPGLAKSLKPIHSPYPLLHITACPVRVFTPRIPHSIVKDEDCTVPRICVSQFLKQCLAAARHTVPEIVYTGDLTIYTFDERDVLLATPKVTKEPITGEGWIVPHRLSNWELKPSIIGKIRVVEVTQSGESDLDRFVAKMALRVNYPLQWDRDIELVPGTDYVFNIRISAFKTEVTDLKEAVGNEFNDADKGYTVKF